MCSHFLYGWVDSHYSSSMLHFFIRKLISTIISWSPKNMFLSLSIVAWQSQCLFVCKTMSYMTPTLKIAKAKFIYKCCNEE